MLKLSCSARPLLTAPSFSSQYFRPRRLHSLSSSLKMSASDSSNVSLTQPPIEHIVLFKVKPDTDPSLVNSMISGLNNLSSLPMVLTLTAGPVYEVRSRSPLTFTHMLHSRYPTKEALGEYTVHDAHMSVVKGNVLPICEDIMAVDWVAQEGLSGPIGVKPGSAMRVQFVKLKEELGEQEKGEVLGVVGGLKEKVSGIEQLSFGENFSARAKGFSIASIGVFSGVEELEKVGGNVEVADEKDKVREYIDSLVIVDYVVPNAQNSSL